MGIEASAVPIRCARWASCVVLLACGTRGEPHVSATQSTGLERAEATSPRLPVLPSRRAGPGAAFAAHWYDGKAELSGYRIRTPRYGEVRDGELVLIYVTEPHDERTWIKDDDVEEAHRVQVLKLNLSLKFLTGVYPYSVMTSVFAPVDDYGLPRFSPIKITHSTQEWCGHVFHSAWLGAEGFDERITSYFASEGERDRHVDVPPGTVYEDGLMIQLRELDGPFAGGRDFEGMMVPSLWRVRQAHRPAAPVAVTIHRADADRDGIAVTRFELRAGEYERVIDVEKALPHRILGWRTNEGEEASLLKTARLEYWNLHDEGDETHRAEFGLE